MLYNDLECGPSWLCMLQGSSRTQASAQKLAFSPSPLCCFPKFCFRIETTFTLAWLDAITIPYHDSTLDIYIYIHTIYIVHSYLRLSMYTYWLLTILPYWCPRNFAGSWRRGTRTSLTQRPPLVFWDFRIKGGDSYIEITTWAMGIFVLFFSLWGITRVEPSITDAYDCMWWFYDSVFPRSMVYGRDGCSILFLADLANKGSVRFPGVLSEDQQLRYSNLHWS